MQLNPPLASKGFEDVSFVSHHDSRRALVLEAGSSHVISCETELHPRHFLQGEHRPEHGWIRMEGDKRFCLCVCLCVSACVCVSVCLCEPPFNTTPRSLCVSLISSDLTESGLNDRIVSMSLHVGLHYGPLGLRHVISSRFTSACFVINSRRWTRSISIFLLQFGRL